MDEAMTVIKYNRFGLRFKEIWFNNLDSIEESNVDVIQFKESYSAINNSLSPFKNGIIRLSGSFVKVQAEFDKGFRYESKRAERESIVVEELRCDAIQLQEILPIYIRFCSDKNITPIPSRFLLLYLSNRCLSIWLAKQGETILQFHFYFLSAPECVLLASFPATRSELIKSSVIGYGNRYLHSRVIEEMFNKKIDTYNLGGIGNSNNERTKGIVKFKMEMSPRTDIYFNGLVGVTQIGKLYIFLLKIFK